MLDSNLHILDKNVAEYMDVFSALMLYICEESIIPEIAEIFGKEDMTKFLDIFAGTTIKVPSRDIITNAARDADIYTNMSKQRSTPSQLAAKHGITPDTVKEIYDRTKAFMRGVNARR